MEDKVKPTVDWMVKTYNRLNKELFEGRLGVCEFNVFTTGRGSSGNVLGWFKIQNKNIRIRRINRRLFNSYSGEVIDKRNFWEECKPKIELNGNYSWTERAMIATLAHEMCHYYTYMNGFAPKQAHGKEFKEIGAIISSRSKGLFTIQRLASAETMSELELDANVAKANQDRKDRKMSRIKMVFVFTDNGKVEFSQTTKDDLIKEIIDTNKKRGTEKNNHESATRGVPIKIVTSTDPKLIKYLSGLGYSRAFTTYRFWNVGNSSWINSLSDYDIKTVWSADGSDIQIQNKNSEETKPQKRMFKIKLKDGSEFTTDGGNYFGLLNALKKRFPLVSDENLKKLINNPKNYIMTENFDKKLSMVIEGVMEDFVKSNEDDSIAISPDMNLGVKSPLEDSF